MKRSLLALMVGAELLALSGVALAKEVNPCVREASEIVFSKKMISVDGHKLTVEIADTDEKTARGLMCRKSLSNGAGMLFIFPDEQLRHFWMKNTFIPLSIGYYDSNKKLVDIQKMKPVKSIMEKEIPSYPSKAEAQFALEVPQGWFEKNKVSIGSSFKFFD